MIKNLTTNQLLLVALAAVLLLIAAFAFFLLENPGSYPSLLHLLPVHPLLLLQR
jgi:hypothetical protein